MKRILVVIVVCLWACGSVAEAASKVCLVRIVHYLCGCNQSNVIESIEAIPFVTSATWAVPELSTIFVEYDDEKGSVKDILGMLEEAGYIADAALSD